MSEAPLPANATATALSPQFESQIYGMYSAEVEGLTEPQLDFESDRWEWKQVEYPPHREPCIGLGTSAGWYSGGVASSFSRVTRK